MAGVLATSLGVAVLDAPAGAATPASCTKATFKTDLKKKTSTSQVSGCTKGPATALTLVASFPTLTNIKTTITWKSGGGTNGPFKITEKAVKTGNKCGKTGAKQDTLIVSTGTVASGTGKAASLKGTKFSESLCVKPNQSTYLMAGTKIVI